MSNRRREQIARLRRMLAEEETVIEVVLRDFARPAPEEKPASTAEQPAPQSDPEPGQ